MSRLASSMASQTRLMSRSSISTTSRFQSLPLRRATIRNQHSHAIPASSFPHPSPSSSRLWAAAAFAAAAAAATGSILLLSPSSSSPSPQPVTTTHDAASLRDGDDPLDLLNPHVLSTATTHLHELPLSDLVRQYVVYLASSQPALVDAGPSILHGLEWTRDHVPVLGTLVWKVFALSMGTTFYSVFVGGPTVPECSALVDTLAKRGVGCLLNYSAEAPLDGTGRAKGLILENIHEAFNAVRAASTLHPTSFSSSSTSTSSSSTTSQDSIPVYTIKPTMFAIKLTGLVRDAQLFARASNALTSSSQWQRGVALPAGTLFPASPELSEEDHAVLAQLHEGLRQVCGEARDGGVRLLVDAEQSWFQPAIDRYADLLAEEFNKVNPDNSRTAPAIPIVHNTYQAYLRTTPANMASSIARAEAGGYAFGAKLVRGAYVESERKRHQASGALGDCVVWNNKAETDSCFDECALVLERRVARDILEGKPGEAGTGAFFATHNGMSCKKVLEALRSQGLAKDKDGGLDVDERVRGRVGFGQLLGMSDNLTTTLTTVLAPSESNVTSDTTVPIVFKYVPYATLDQALPYLIRRANENQSILAADPTSGRGGAKGELKAVGKEIRSRLGLSF
ncbi:FAD-linked oxidoreductase [Meredithblackwellia eburnea MCA 4105]